jgi:NAD kinase
MKIGIFLLKQGLKENERYIALCNQLRSASYELYEIESKADIRPLTDLVLSIGGDGTFLSAAQTV